MVQQIIDLGEKAFLLINGLLIFFNIPINIFYAFCLIFPLRSGQQLQQPLKMLLRFLVWFRCAYFVSLTAVLFVVKEQESFEMFLLLLWLFLMYCTYNSMTCSVWLNFYFYIQIVPPKRALLIWVKRNIGSFICVVLTVDWMLFFICEGVNVADEISVIYTYTNGTWTEKYIHELHFTRRVCFFINHMHIFIGLCIMMVSSFSTALYLHRHARNMAQNGSHFTTSNIQSQKRVTITGIFQGLFYIFYYTFYLFYSFIYVAAPHFVLRSWSSFTVTSLYMSGATLSLGIGQATFRQRLADGWKTLKALCGIGMVTDDVKLHSSRLTSSEIANIVTVDQMSL